MQSFTTCPDLYKLRSLKVQKGIDHQKISGDWQENAQVDIAQIQSKCPKFTNIKSNNGFEQTLNVTQVSNIIPFQQTQSQDSINLNDSAENGIQTKQLKGVKFLLAVPTVFIDFIEDDDQQKYLIEFNCKNVAGFELTELRFSSRYDSITDDKLEELKKMAQDAGIKQSLLNDITIADHANC